MAKKVKAKKTIVKKGWVSILAPKMFKEQEIGESYIANHNSLIGRKLTVNMMTLTKDPKKQGMNVHFEIVGKTGNGMVTRVCGFKLVNSSVKRMVRRGRDKIDDSFILVSKDGVKIRIKPFFQTRGKTPNSVQTKIRLNARKILTEALAKTNYDNFVRDIINFHFRRTLFESLKKIYPLQTTEIRWLKALHNFSEKSVPEVEAPIEERSRERPRQERTRSEKPRQERPREKPVEKKEVKVEAKPEVKTEAKPAVKTETKPAVKTEAKVEEKEAKPEKS